MEQRISITEIVDEILAEVSEHHRPLVIFDLDSTLFNVSLRTQAIVAAFTGDAEMTARFPREVEFLSKLKISARDWGLRQAIERNGFKGTKEFGKIIREYWRSRFFSSDFLHADRPYPGSREGVLRLHNAGAVILYLTGRDERNMKDGTIESLKYWGFPLNFEKPEIDVRRDKPTMPANLIMKPIKGSVDDEVFKEIEMRKIVERYRSQHQDIWFFENEPVIVERVRAATPFVRTVWVDTTHSGRGEAPVGLPILEWESFDGPTND